MKNKVKERPAARRYWDSGGGSTRMLLEINTRDAAPMRTVVDGLLPEDANLIVTALNKTFGFAVPESVVARHTTEQQRSVYEELLALGFNQDDLDKAIEL